jgi:hypothetical protein
MKIVVGLLMCAALAACDKGPRTSEASEASKPTPTGNAASGGNAAASGGNEQKFGAGVALADTTPIDQLLENPGAFKGKTVRVEGMVTDVCPKRGCWFEMAGTKPGQKLRFKVTDGEMVFPMESKGMHAVAQGQVAVKDLTLEESKQYAEYQAKEYGKAYDPASITEPMQIVRLDGTGAIFRDKK